MAVKATPRRGKRTRLIAAGAVPLALAAILLGAAVVIRDRGEVWFFHNGREFPAQEVYLCSSTGRGDAELYDPVQFGDKFGFRVREGTNLLEEVSGTVDKEGNIWFSNSVEFSVEGMKVYQVLQELSFIDNILHTPQGLTPEEKVRPGQMPYPFSGKTEYNLKIDPPPRLPSDP
jgi:hypothetical protein